MHTWLLAPPRLRRRLRWFVALTCSGRPAVADHSSEARRRSTDASTRARARDPTKDYAIWAGESGHAWPPKEKRESLESARGTTEGDLRERPCLSRISTDFFEEPGVIDLLRISGLVWLGLVMALALISLVGVYFAAASAPGVALILLAARLRKRREAREHPTGAA